MSKLNASISDLNTTLSNVKTLQGAIDLYKFIENYISEDLLISARKYMFDGAESETKQDYIVAKNFYIQAADTLIAINECEKMLTHLKNNHLISGVLYIDRICKRNSKRSSIEKRRLKIKEIINKVEQIVSELAKRNLLKKNPNSTIKEEKKKNLQQQ